MAMRVRTSDPIERHRGTERLNSMSSRLHQSTTRARARLEKSVASRPLAELQRIAADLPRPRNFFRALVDPRGSSPFRVIAEILRSAAAPEGTADTFDPVDMARRYQRAGASALSVPTEFDEGGSGLDSIAAIRRATPLPILHKQLLVDPYQVWESRVAGADAILLVAEALTEGQIIDFQILAAELGMTTVVQIHDAWNLLRVIRHVGFPDASGCLVAIDNRDPQTLAVDLETSRRLAELIEQRSILVSEGGLATNEHLTALKRHGFHIALLGETLLGEADPGEALRNLLEAA
jgi:indole-3-glycerol phosphate synthase